MLTMVIGWVALLVGTIVLWTTFAGFIFVSRAFDNTTGIWIPLLCVGAVAIMFSYLTCTHFPFTLTPKLL